MKTNKVLLCFAGMMVSSSCAFSLDAALEEIRQQGEKQRKTLLQAQKQNQEVVALNGKYRAAVFPKAKEAEQGLDEFSTDDEVIAGFLEFLKMDQRLAEASLAMVQEVDADFDGGVKERSVKMQEVWGSKKQEIENLQEQIKQIQDGQEDAVALYKEQIKQQDATIEALMLGVNHPVLQRFIRAKPDLFLQIVEALEKDPRGTAANLEQALQ